MGAAVQVLNNPSSLGSGAKLCNFHTFHSHIVVKWFCVKASYKCHASCFFLKYLVALKGPRVLGSDLGL